MGMPAGVAPYVTFFLSLLASIIDYLARVYPEMAGLFDALVGAVVLWLTVSGAYKKAKDAGVPGLRK